MGARKGRLAAYAEHYIMLKDQVDGMKVRGRPRCPCCRTPLNIVYEGASGKVGEKCKKCRTSCIVDVGQMRTYKIVEEILPFPAAGVTMEQAGR